MNKVILGLGANLGDREAHLAEACRHLSVELGRVVKTSSLYESPPWGYKSSNWFLNQVVVLETQMQPPRLLDGLLDIERVMGRVRKGHYSDRKIDLDILFWLENSVNRVIRSKELSIPHPLIENRRFVLLPLAEILPEMIHPVLNLSVSQLLNNCTDAGEVNRLTDSRSRH